MAKTYKQRIYDDLDKLVDKYPNAKVSDVLVAKGRKVIERTARYRLG